MLSLLRAKLIEGSSEDLHHLGLRDRACNGKRDGPADLSAVCRDVMSGDLCKLAYAWCKLQLNSSVRLDQRNGVSKSPKLVSD